MTSDLQQRRRVKLFFRGQLAAVASPFLANAAALVNRVFYSILLLFLLRNDDREREHSGFTFLTMLVEPSASPRCRN